MIERFAKGAARFCVHRDVFADNEAEVYTYGFELLLSTLINISLVILIGLLLDSLTGAIAFMAGFILLRAVSGGYHASSHGACILLFGFVFLVSCIAVKQIPVSAAHLYIIVSNLVSAIIIYVLAPVEAKNKPLSAAKRRRHRNYSILLSCINLFVSIVIFFLPAILGRILVFYFTGGLAAALSLVAAAKVSGEGGQETCSKQ